MVYQNLGRGTQHHTNCKTQVSRPIQGQFIGGRRGIMKCSLFHYSCSKLSIIPSFQSRKSHYSVIPEKPRPLFHYSCSKISIIPLFQSRKSHYSVSQNLIINSIIPLFQGNVIVDDYSKGNVVIPLFPKNQGHYSIIPLQKFPLFHYSSPENLIIPLHPLKFTSESDCIYLYHIHIMSFNVL